MSRTMIIATIKGTDRNGQPEEYKLPVVEAEEVHALQWVLKDREWSYNMEDYVEPHPAYSMSFTESSLRHTVVWLNYETALWLMNALADAQANPHMVKTVW